MRSVTRREQEWDDEQAGWMLALAEWRSTQCRQCGGDLLETTDPANENAYVAQPPFRCHRCTALARSEADYRDAKHPHALMHVVQLRQRG